MQHYKRVGTVATKGKGKGTAHSAADAALEAWQHTAALLIEPARRLEMLGRRGIEYNGVLWTSAQLEAQAGGVMSPLPPFAMVYHPDTAAQRAAAEAKRVAAEAKRKDEAEQSARKLTEAIAHELAYWRTARDVSAPLPSRAPLSGSK
jgi:hypothetical protein